MSGRLIIQLSQSQGGRFFVMTRCRGSRCTAKYRASQNGPNEIQVRDRHGALLSALRVVTEKHQRECAMADLPPLPELRFAEVSATSRLRYVGDRFCYMEAGKTASSLPLKRSQPTWSEVRLTCMGVFLSSGFLVCAGSLFEAERPFLVPSPAIRFAERAERCQGTEMLAQLSGLPLSVACVFAAP